MSLETGMYFPAALMQNIRPFCIIDRDESASWWRITKMELSPAKTINTMKEIRQLIYIAPALAG